jgi:protein required for attachment to host cells
VRTGVAITTTRVLVAHDAGCRAFEQHGRGKKLTLLSEIDFEDGRRHSGELDADRPGRSVDRSGQGHAYEAHLDTRQHAVSQFAKELAHDLAREFHLGAFRELVIIAPPRFLGMLRDSLDTKLRRALIATLAKDLPRANEEEIRTHLAAVMWR